jgi:selenocysteine lyase/cysteine desulfurase
MFPRAALWLLKYALEERKRKGADGQPPLLDAAALRAAMPSVARERFAELKAECSNAERKLLDSLQGFNNYQNEEDFQYELRKHGQSQPEEVTRTLAELGVIERGSRQDKTPTIRIVDLYAFAAELKIKRLGRR